MVASRIGALRLGVRGELRHHLERRIEAQLRIAR